MQLQVIHGITCESLSFFSLLSQFPYEWLTSQSGLIFTTVCGRHMRMKIGPRVDRGK